MLKKGIHIVFTGILLFTVSCSGYEKILKSTDVEMKFNKALEYYAEEDFVKASTLLEQISPYYRGTKKSDTISYYIANSYFQMKDYIQAAYFFKEYTQTYPRGTFAEKAEFLHAYCNYMQSPRPSLDQEYTFKAIESFQLFLIKYPGTDKRDEVLTYLDELKNKLVEKSYLSAKLYYDLGYYEAALVSLRNSIYEYPDSKFREDIMFLILKSNYLFAANSVESKKKERLQNTLDEYYSFISEYPKSDHQKEVEKIYEDSTKELNL
ncbi:MAG: outer membrane protein assembly factor BamD [Bacteroidota bacterium]